MAYVTWNISDKIEMSQFKTEDEAHAWCHKGYYAMYIVFEGTFEDVDAWRARPVAMYVKGKRFGVEESDGG